MNPLTGTQPGPERRNRLLELIKESEEPVTASSLARTLGVTRQVIVQDVALLRASKASILSTPRGYIYQHPADAQQLLRIIYCKHSYDDTARELQILVDHGITIRDVGIEHSVYGTISRELNLKSRLDVSNFISHIARSDVSLLSALTHGLHYHTLIGPNTEALDLACRELAKAGIIKQEEEPFDETL